MYDFVFGRQFFKSSYVVGKKKVLEFFSMFKKEKLCGVIIYYDGELVFLIYVFLFSCQFFEMFVKK